MQIRKEEDLEQSIRHTINGKNIADTRWIETKTSKFNWSSKEEWLYGFECDVYQRESCVISCCDEYTWYHERAQR